MLIPIEMPHELALEVKDLFITDDIHCTNALSLHVRTKAELMDWTDSVLIVTYNYNTWPVIAMLFEHENTRFCPRMTSTLVSF